MLRSRTADLVEALARVEERLGAHTTMLMDIQTNAKATNGRVSKLERAWWYARGFVAALTAAVGYLVASGHLHFH